MTIQIYSNKIDQTKTKIRRLKPSLKWSVMILSVLALSLVFEGWRQIKTGLTLEHMAVLLAGVLSTAILLWIQAFWIYVEEKSKGTLKKKIVHFDRLDEYLGKEGNVIKGPKDILVIILAACTLLVAGVFLPWSELGFNGNFPDWLNDLMTHLGIADFVIKNFNSLAQHQQLMDVIKSDHVVDKMGDYAYALFLFLAISAASIAIILVGKEENTEKTVLEIKK